MNDFDTTALCAALAIEQKLYERMRELSRQQLAAAESSDANILLELVGRKDALMEDITRAAAASAGLKTAWAEARERVNAADRKRAEEALGGLGALLEEIFALDDRTRELVQGSREEVQQSLRRIQQSRTMTRAYKQPAPPRDPRFTDTET